MDGILIVDKPGGWTSHDVVARARRILREKRVGHTGTLDPFATGVLVLLVGRATRLAQFLAGAEKEYEATIRLGYATDTGDLTGAPRGELRPCADAGREEVERKAVRVRVGEFEITADEAGAWLRPNDDGTCDLRARVVCSAGTYVRALAESLGERLKTGAHLAALRRTRAGEFGLERAILLEELPQLVEA